MKFCGKCHKMVVDKIVNSNNRHRICICDLNSCVLASASVLSRLRSEAQSKTMRNNRARSKRSIRIIDSRESGVRAIFLTMK